MKKIAILLVCISATTLSLAANALAFSNGNYGLDVTAQKANYAMSGSDSTIEGLSQRIVNGFLSAMSIFFFFLMLYGGLRWMTARGNAEFTEKGRNIIEAAILGLAIMLAAYGITTFVFRALTGG